MARIGIINNATNLIKYYPTRIKQHDIKWQETVVMKVVTCIHSKKNIHKKEIGEK